ncbi:MAG: DUF4435 domain-containing protein [Zoogloeaceae bacterium]|nr:DUF4435 domain-containing protein [Zoogloeaceae bacterium]
MSNLRAEEMETAAAISKNRRRIKVFLEGRDDFSLFSLYWFQSYANEIEFCEAEKGPAQLSGCRGVLENVRKLREDAGSNAFGIVDRDALLVENRFADISETNDNVFLKNTHDRNPYIYYTLYWEIENYLVAVRKMEEVRCDSLHEPLPCRSDEVVAKEIWEHCETLIPHAAINIFFHKRGRSKWGDGATNNYNTRREVESHICESFLQEGEFECYQSLVDLVETFDDTSLLPWERVRLMLRRIHGKALLQRFFRRSNVQGKMHWHLARGCPGPTEIVNKLQEWVNQHSRFP